MSRSLELIAKCESIESDLSESVKPYTGGKFIPQQRELDKMAEYYKKGSNPKSLASSVSDPNKALSRFFLARSLKWEPSWRAFFNRYLNLVGGAGEILVAYPSGKRNKHINVDLVLDGATIKLKDPNLQIPQKYSRSVKSNIEKFQDLYDTLTKQASRFKFPLEDY